MRHTTRHTAFTLTLLLLGLFGRQGATADSAPDKAGGNGASRTMLEFQLKDARDDAKRSEADIKKLKDYNSRVAEALKQAGELKTPETPKYIEEFKAALETIKALPEATVLDPAKIPAVQKIVDIVTADSRQPNPEVPPAIYQLVNRGRNDLVISAVMENIVREGDYGNTYTSKNLEAILRLIWRERDMLPVETLPTRQKISQYLDEAIKEMGDAPEQAKKQFANSVAGFKKYCADLSSAVVKEIERRETAHKVLVNASDELAKQLGELEKAQGKNVSDLIQQLPWLVGILCGLFVGLILIIRFYPPEQQTEWVASGQVIQLLTVVTLLLIILCLAVTHVILENTIGTLLGGIGGYVLSQGIGRAAAREASRKP